MYYALWIPCLTPGFPEVIEQKIIRNLKDVNEFEACRFISIVNPVTHDITLSYSLSSSQPFRTVVFNCSHHTRAGMLIYRLDIAEASDRVCENLMSGMHPSIYHIIKRHFHRHRFHDEECDTLLKPYCSESEIDISNQALMKKVHTFYLEQYCTKLQGDLNDISAQYIELKSLEKKNWYWTYLKQAKRIKGLCDQAVGESAYAKSLLTMSRATVKTRIYEKITSRTTDLDRLSSKCTETYTFCNNRYNNRLGMYGLIVGLGGILLTISLELLKSSGKPDYDKYRDEYIRLKQRADSLNNENIRVLKEITNQH